MVVHLPYPAGRSWRSRPVVHILHLFSCTPSIILSCTPFRDKQSRIMFITKITCLFSWFFTYRQRFRQGKSITCVGIFRIILHPMLSTLKPLASLPNLYIFFITTQNLKSGRYAGHAFTIRFQLPLHVNTIKWFGQVPKSRLSVRKQTQKEITAPSLDSGYFFKYRNLRVNRELRQHLFFLHFNLTPRFLSHQYPLRKSGGDIFIYYAGA